MLAEVQAGWNCAGIRTGAGRASQWGLLVSGEGQEREVEGDSRGVAIS